MHHPLRPPRLTIGPAALLFCLSFCACASDAATEKRFRALQEEVDRVQSRADRLEERLTAVEVGRQKQTLHLDQEGDVSVEARPKLKVVKMSPKSDTSQAKRAGAGTVGEVGKESEPRPIIRATGSAEGRIENLEPSSPTTTAPVRQGPATQQESDGGS
jgi:hypothetical protein